MRRQKYGRVGHTVANIGKGLATAFLLTGPIVAMSWAAAQGVGSTATHHYDIPPGPLDDALNRFAAVSGIRLLYPAALAQGLTTSGVTGDFVTRDALNKLLAGTALSSRFVDEQTVTLNTS
ncbi:MAG TPA: STN domain-containing protein, partial [Steroidobacteraceae bacterium]